MVGVPSFLLNIIENNNSLKGIDEQKGSKI